MLLPRSSGIHLTIVVAAESGFGVDAIRELLLADSLPDQPLCQTFDRRTGTDEFTISTYSRSLPRYDQLAEALKINPAVLSFAMLLMEDAGAGNTDG